MQSSTTRAVRAIILLASLILIPLVALFGSSLPELAARIMDGGWGRQTAFSDDERLTEAPTFRPEGEPPVTASAPRQIEVGAVVPAHAAATSGREVPAGYNAPLGTANPGASYSAGPSPGLPGPGLSTPGMLDPAMRQTATSPPLATLAPTANVSVSANPQLGGTGLDPIRPAGQASYPPGAPGDGLGQASAQGVGPDAGALPGSVQPTGLDADRLRLTGSQGEPTSPPSPTEGGTFVRFQERLRDLGAVYYKLESWGSQQQLFRFQCEMAVGGSPGLTRHFEAVDNNPLLAMHKVLVEAEAWQASR